MIPSEIQQLKTSSRELRKFGLLVGAIFALLTAWSWWRGKPAYPYWLIPALPLLLLGWLWPLALKWPYLAWMSLGLGLGWIVSTILLTVFYYLVLTPIGLLARLTGNDFLSRRLSPGATTYWIRRAPGKGKQPQSYERQF